MWKKSYIVLVLCLLSYCSPPFVYCQSTDTTLDESWQTFEALIQNLNKEIETTEQELQRVQDSSTLSINLRNEMISNLQTQLKAREAELQELKDRYEHSRIGEQSTKLLNEKLSEDLKVERRNKTISIGVNLALIIALIFSIIY